MQKLFLDLPGLQHYHSLLLGLFEPSSNRVFTKTEEEALNGDYGVLYFTTDTKHIVLNGQVYTVNPQEINDYITQLEDLIDDLQKQINDNLELTYALS